jgi:hypothetical protein
MANGDRVILAPAQTVQDNELLSAWANLISGSSLFNSSFIDLVTMAVDSYLNKIKKDAINGFIQRII